MSAPTMTPFELGRVIWEARVREAWGATYGETLIARTPWPDHAADPSMTEAHRLCVVQAKAAIKALAPEAAG